MKKRMQFDEKSHQYSSAEGKKYISVTKAIDLAGLMSDWARDEAAAERGTAVHLATRLYDEKNFSLLKIHLRETVEMETEGYLEAHILFLKQSRFKVELIEHRVVDELYGYAGTLDRKGILNGQKAIGDLKSSKTGRTPLSTAWQTAAYANAYKRGGRFLRFGLALHPDGTYNVTLYPPKDMRSDLEDFLAVLRVTRLRKKLGITK